MRPVRLSALFALALAGACPACVSKEVRASAETVLSLRSGTMSELRQRRGQGPFTRYDVPPERMLKILEAAARHARGAGGQPVRAIFVSPARGEVVAKERSGKDARRSTYTEPFDSAMLAIVHADSADAQSCRVEVHALQSGPFHRGSVEWMRDMPGWIDEELRARAEAGTGRILPIP